MYRLCETRQNLVYFTETMISKVKLQKFNRRTFRNGALIATLSILIFSAGCGRGEVASADHEADANRMFDILHSNGFRVTKTPPVGEVKVWKIEVEEGWFDDSESAYAIKVLQDYGLPRNDEPEVKTESSITGMKSQSQELEQERREKQKGIERHLYTLPDVVGVDARITQPKEGAFDQEKTPATASVTLIVLKKTPGFTKDDVRKAVSGAVTNLSPDGVNVIITHRPLREIPYDQLFARRKSETIFSVGIGVILLLGAILGVVWVFNKRRKALPFTTAIEDGEDPERDLLEGKNEE